MKKQDSVCESFIVRILNDQNATWQGTITWTESRLTESFRSELELIRLIDSAIAHHQAVLTEVPAVAEETDDISKFATV